MRKVSRGDVLTCGKLVRLAREALGVGVPCLFEDDLYKMPVVAKEIWASFADTVPTE